MTTKSTNNISAGYEPIQGYVLVEIIGRGGYGEVWRAVAPGGINKAVKIVYGNLDDERAEQELKSLERIKTIQHPFILTLERFDLVNNQLVIITEFAEGSLEDLFKEHTDRGSCGIPRKKLLSHLFDTADALDYLHQLYKLQHLDIKPANLLMIGGRIKVADFGLLKDLKDVNQSVISGLTPIYAPPELFDGRPSMHSDQYSLAVMYQELLTGTRPFAGRTIAQLASQHVYNAPNLSPLPARDRSIVARALEKAPDRRFGSCTEFVDALQFKQKESVSVAVAKNSTQDLEVSDLPAIKPTKKHTRASRAQRALVVGIGGTGADCVRGLREKVFSLRNTSPLALHSVTIDIDWQDSGGMYDEEESDFLPYHSAISTPLRSSHEYRNRGTEHLQSISRRWIYNVPKSLKTEGIRPLGRLALIDHSERVTKGLVEAIQSLASDSCQPPRIYVVASLAGGTGSGMVFDTACLLRSLLDENGFHEAEILPLLSTVAMQGDPTRPLALHSTTAALQELSFFMQLKNGYPGDNGATWKRVPSARSPLSKAYLFAESKMAGALTPTQTIKDYIWADSTFAGDYLCNARESEKTTSTRISGSMLRSAGILHLESGKKKHHDITAIALQILLRQWLGNPANVSPKLDKLVQRINRRCKLSAETFLSTTLATVDSDPKTRRAILVSKLKSLSDQVLGDEHFRAMSVTEVVKAVSADFGSCINIDEVLTNVSREVVVRINDNTLNLAAAIQFVETLEKQASGMQAELEETLGRIQRQSPKVVAKQHVAQMQSDDIMSDWSEQMRTTESEDLRLACAMAQIELEAAAAKSTLESAKSLGKELQAYRMRLSTLATDIAKAIRLLPEKRLGLLQDRLGEKADALIGEIHDSCVVPFLIKPFTEKRNLDSQKVVLDLNDVVCPLVSLAVKEADEIAERNASIANDSGHQSQDLNLTTQLGQIQESSDTELPCSNANTCAKKTASNTLVQPSDPNSRKPYELSLAESVAAARPALLDVGGAQRLILFASSESESKSLMAKLKAHCQESNISIVIDKDASSVMIHEAQQVDIDQVIQQYRIVSGDTNLSKKLMTRADVEWNLSRSPYEQS